MVRQIKKTEKLVEDKIEELFDIEPGTTMVEYNETLPAEVVTTEEYDKKDISIEEQLEEVYNSAMDLFEVQSKEVEQVEGKFKARNAEVAATILNTALSAISKKADIKAHKDKLKEKVRTSNSGTVTNNNLIIDRNDLLKALSRKKED